MRADDRRPRALSEDVPFGLKPHVVQTWKLSTDPAFIAEVRDVAEYCQRITGPGHQGACR